MSTLKKLFASLASLAVLLSTSASAFAVFSDVPSWAQPAVDALVEQGVIDGSKPAFESARNVQRDEFTKMVVEAAVGGVDPDLVPATPTFNDLPTTAWSYGHVETANTLEIVGGYPDGSFRAANPANRAEAIKIIVNGFALETMNEPKENFTDVADTDWFAGYVTTAANHCLINTDRSTFRPADNLIRAEAAQLIYNAWRISNGEDLCTDDGEPSLDPEGDEDEDGIKNADDNCPMDANEDQADEDNDGTGDVCEGATGPATSDLEVELSSDTPEAMTIPRGGNNIAFLTLDLTANGDEDVEVKGITVAREGIGEEDDIESVKVLDGLIKRGSDRSFSSDEQIAALNLSSDPVVVEAGTTKTIVIAADIDDTADVGGEHRFTIDLADDITAVGAETGGDVEVSGDFPIEGETMRIGSVDVSSLDFEFRNVSDSEIEVGEKDVEVCRMQLTAGSEGDVLLQGMALEFDGLDADQVTNMVIELGGEPISEVVETLDNSGKAVFDFTDLEDGGLLFQDGDSRNLTCRADIIGGVDEELTVKFDDVESDVAAYDMRFGFGVDLTETGTPDEITVRGGDINVTLNSDGDDRDIAPDQDDVVFDTLTIENNGEAIDVRGTSANGLCLILETSEATDGDAIADISDVRLREVDGGTVFGPEDPVAVGGNDGIVQVCYDDETTIDSGETLTLEIVADVESVVTTGDTFQWTLDIDTLEVEGVDSGDESQGGAGNAGDVHEIRPTADQDGDLYTVKEPTLTVSRRSTNNDTYVAQAEDVLLWSGNLRANGVQDLLVQSLSFDEVGTSVDNDIDELSLYMVEGNTRTLIDSGEELTGGTVTFNGLESDGDDGLLVQAGDEVRVELRGDIATTISAPGATVIMRITAAGDVEVEEAEDNDIADVTGTFPVTGATYTLATTGSLVVNLDDAETPDSMLLVADGSETWHEIAAFSFEADDEGADIDDLRVEINPVDTTTVPGTCDISAETVECDVANDTEVIDAVGLFYADGTQVQKQVQKDGGAEAETFDVAGGVALIEDLDLTIDPSEDTTLFVRVMLNEIDENVSNAESGMAFNVNLGFNAGESDVMGAESNDEYADADITVENDGGVDDETDVSDTMYVMANRLTATKVSSSTALTGGTDRELLRVKLAKAVTGSDAFLNELNVRISTTGGAAVTAASLELVNDQGVVIATAAGAVAVNSTADINFDITAGSSSLGATFDEIEGPDETYTVRGDVTTDGTDDQIVTTLFVNGATPGTTADGVLWRDAGAEGDGTDGADIKWIDLGDDTSTTRLENILDN